MNIFIKRISYSEKFLFLICLWLLLPEFASSQSFVHPGILHSREDLDRMKKAVAAKEEPIYAGYEVFRQNPVSQHTYKMQGPMAMVGRNPTVGQGVYDSDANAAHQNAIMWAITGEKAYANKAIEIINAWSTILKSITGRDAVLMAGLGPFKMVNAAEIIRYTNAGWAESEIKQTENHFKEVIYPVLKDFAPFANGNWDAAAIKTVMAIGVFCNDKAIFESALRYYVNGHGDGRLTHYVINETGQIQESGRDQAHTQLGVAMLAECSEIAWHQGLNLYGYANNRLLKGFEYVANFNLGNEVPFVNTIDRTGKYVHRRISQQARGELRAVYEQVYHHYVSRMGLDAPYTQKAAEKIRPEGPGRPGADHPGYGTLFFTKPKTDALKLAFATRPASPGGLIATGTSKEVQLVWVESIGANSYQVKRSNTKGGPYKVIADKVQASTYRDTGVKLGEIYYYTVLAVNTQGQSADAFSTSIAAGLPAPWKQQDVGESALAGRTTFDGTLFKLEGRGLGPDSLSDQFHFAYVPLKGNGEIVARFVPQPSSQFSRMGLMMRESLAVDAAHMSLLIYPGKTGQIEAPNWHLRLLNRVSAGQKTQIAAVGGVLPEPVVTHGRLTGSYWLKLERKGNTFSGYSSLDGKTWTQIGSATNKMKKNIMVGVPAAAGIPTITTTVMFDEVKAPYWK